MNNFIGIENGMLLGPQPSDADLQQAKRQGIKTIIDFRLPSELQVPNAELAARNGLDYVNIPVNKAALSKDQITDLADVLKKKEGPFLLHCATGARAAMLLVLSKAKENHWSAERTFEEARSVGYDLEKSPDFAAFIRSAVAS